MRDDHLGHRFGVDPAPFDGSSRGPRGQIGSGYSGVRITPRSDTGDLFEFLDDPRRALDTLLTVVVEFMPGKIAVRSHMRRNKMTCSYDDGSHRINKISYEKGWLAKATQKQTKMSPDP